MKQELIELRDYFAAAAMQGLLAKQGGYAPDTSLPEYKYCGLSEDVMDVDKLAEYSYAQADAMMMARKVKHGCLEEKN